jgi:hypothetical protein
VEANSGDGVVALVSIDPVFAEEPSTEHSVNATSYYSHVRQQGAEDITVQSSRTIQATIALRLCEALKSALPPVERPTAPPNVPPKRLDHRPPPDRRAEPCFAPPNRQSLRQRADLNLRAQ